MSIFVTPVVDEYGTTYSLTTAGYTGLVIIAIVLLLIGCAIFGGKKKFSAKQLAFAAMAIALATVASFIKVWHMPMGGSVTLFSMLFISVIGYWYGPGVGFTTALAYGVLQLIIDPYILTLPQMLVDYIFAFGALGCSGFFHKDQTARGLRLGYIASVLGRYFFAFISGWIFFGVYASYYGFNSGVVYSLVYNGAYLGAEAVITYVLLRIPAVSKGLNLVKQMAISEK